ncbi:unnamed protein product [Ascophyllum nodosum]
MRASWLRRAVARALFFFSMATHFEGSPGISPPEECTACVTNASSISASPLLSYPPASDTSLVRELLRPFSLENFALEYFEKGPLVIRGRSPDHYQRVMKFGIGDVDTIIENGVAHAGEQEQMILGRDWKIIKRVFVHADGEFWTAGLPPRATKRSEALVAEGGGGVGSEGRVVSLAEARAAFQKGGFSVVINRLQRRWRGVAEVALALEDVLGHPVNANLYMTPPGSQGFEAHFDWMDGIVVQVAGSKTWVLYDEMVAAPRPDLKYKPAAADLGEPIAVLELHPGDLMYIPRGWPHEAAVNGTARVGGGAKAHDSRSRGGSKPSLHVTFGVESTLSGTYESMLHHALEAAAAEQPHLFFARSSGADEDETKSDRGPHRQNYSDLKSEAGVPWLELLHIWVHDVASRDGRLRRAVPLAPLFSASRTSPSGLGGDEVSPYPNVAEEFHTALEACVPRGSNGADALSALRLLDSLLQSGDLRRVRDMFEFEDGTWSDEHPETEEDGNDDHMGGCSARSRSPLVREKGRGEWSRQILTTFDRGSFSSSMREKFKNFQEAASVEGALWRMVSAAMARAKDRAATTEQDLARCGQTRKVNQ